MAKTKGTKAPFASIVIVLAVIAIVALGTLSPAFSVPGGNLKNFRERAKEQYGAAFGKYKAAVNEYKDARQGFFQARENFLKARRLGGRNASETDVLAAAKRYMATSSDHLVTLIEHVENEVGILTSVNATDAPGLEQLQENWLNQLEATKANVTAIRSRIENATEKQEIVSAANELGQVWKVVTELSQKIYYLARVERGVALYRRISLVEARIGNRTSELAANGTFDASEIEAELEQVKLALSGAQGSFVEARTYFGEGQREAGKAKMSESHDFLRDALASLRRAYASYRDAAGNEDGA
ncbi:MAG: hypothetical protein V1820_02045 [archaeon]